MAQEVEATKRQDEATVAKIHKPIEKEKKASKKKEVKAKEAKKKETPKEKVVKAVKKKAEINLVEEVVTKRQVKYIYPADCTDTLSRKAHRQHVRNKLKQLELEMFRLQGKDEKEFKKKEKEYLAYKKINVKEGVA